MTKMIEHTLNLPSMNGLLDSEDTEIDEVEMDPALQEVLDIGDAAGKSIEFMSGEDHERAMDEIHKEALKHGRDLIDLGYNVDQRSAATIFEKANMLYKTAVDAKNSKRDAQLKLMKLQLDRKKLELEETKLRHEMGTSKAIETEGEVLVIDRNELIRQMREQAKQDQET